MPNSDVSGNRSLLPIIPASRMCCTEAPTHRLNQQFIWLLQVPQAVAQRVHEMGVATSSVEYVSTCYSHGSNTMN
jgi:hypothetical protein